MTDNETNLAKWTAFARATDPESVGHMLNELAGRLGGCGACADLPAITCATFAGTLRRVPSNGRCSTTWRRIWRTKGARNERIG